MTRCGGRYNRFRSCSRPVRHVSRLKRLTPLPQVAGPCPEPPRARTSPRWTGRIAPWSCLVTTSRRSSTRPRSPSRRSRVGSASPRRRCAPGTAATGSVRPSTPPARTGGTPPPTSSVCSSCGGSRWTASRPPSRPGSRWRRTSPRRPTARSAAVRTPTAVVDAALAGDLDGCARVLALSPDADVLAWWTGLVEPALDGAGPTDRRRPARRRRDRDRARRHARGAARPDRTVRGGPSTGRPGARRAPRAATARRPRRRRRARLARGRRADRRRARRCPPRVRARRDDANTRRGHHRPGVAGGPRGGRAHRRASTPTCRSS